MKRKFQVESVKFVPLAGQGTVGILSRDRMVIRNFAEIAQPSGQGLLDNCLLCLPRRAVEILGLTPNIGDKDAPKTLWLGRVWQLRALLTLYYRTLREEQEKLHPSVRKKALQLAEDINKDPKKMKKLIDLQQAWRKARNKRISRFSMFDRLEDKVRGFVVFMHGSGGMTYNNLRFSRMLAGMDFVVIAPDDMTSSVFRHKDAQKLATLDTPMDYWGDNLVYASDATGAYNYSTQVEGVLENPDYYKDLYEKVYRERASELHYVLGHMPQFVDQTGVYLMGTSEGAMTVARFDDQRYGPLINGRIISAFSVEYCYFTPTPQAGEFGGSMEVPTLQLIGSHDQYFGCHDSIAQLVAKDPVHGYGDKQLKGNAFETMKRQGMDKGCCCVFEGGMHDLTVTHDNALRDIFSTFFSRPGRIHHLHEIWSNDGALAQQLEVLDKHGLQTREGKSSFGGILLCWIKKSTFPQTIPKSKENALRLLHGNMPKHQLDEAMGKQVLLERESSLQGQELTRSMSRKLRDQKKSENATKAVTALLKIPGSGK